MSDLDALRALAEAAKEQVAKWDELRTDLQDHPHWGNAASRYIAAASPDAILALIAERDEHSRWSEYYRTEAQRLIEEKVQARARIEAARDGLHAQRLNMTDWQEVALNEAEAHGFDQALALLNPPEAT